MCLKKVAVVLLTGTLVFSGVVKEDIVKAEEVSDGTTDCLIQEDCEEITAETEDVTTDAEDTSGDMVDENISDVAVNENTSEVAVDESAAVIISADGQETSYTNAKEAGKALKDGETLKLMKDYTASDWGIMIAAANVTVDLNGYNVTSNKVTTSESNGYAIKFKKPNTGETNHTVTIKNSGNKQSILTSCLYQIYATSGNSKYNVIVNLEGDIAFKDTNTEEVPLGVKLDTGAKLLDTETSRKLIPSGGFSVEEADHNRYIYGDYANAVEKSVDKSIRMLHDYTTNTPIYSGNEDGTLDLGGNTYTYTGKTAAININYPNTTLTVKNGKVTATDDTCSGVQAIGAPNQNMMNNRGIVLEGVELTLPGNVYGIVTNGTETGNKVTLKDSVLNVPNGVGIYFPSSGDVVIDNSVINGKYTGVQMCAGNLTVRGDKTAVTVTEKPQDKLEGDGAIADGAAISIVKREGYQPLGSVTIEGGSFKSAKEVEAIKTYIFNNADKTEGVWEDAGDVVEVTGGSFSTVVPENICADQYVSTEIDPATGMSTVKKDTNAPEISLANGGKYYDEKVTFTVKDDFGVVSVTVNGKELTEVDGVYTIEGTGVYTVAAEDRVGNVTEITIEILNKKVLSTDTAEVTLVNKLVENGQEQIQKVKVVVDGIVLVEGTDYEVIGNKAVKAGNYTLKITGIGSYEGSIEVEYTVGEKEIVISPTEPVNPQKPGSQEMVIHPESPTNPQKPADKTTGQNSKTDNVKTGDTTNAAGYVTVMLLAGGIVVLAMSRKLKRR